jgi:phage head maturation protease
MPVRAPVKALWQHDTRELLGSVTVTEDTKGLRAAFALVPDMQRAREAMALAKNLRSLLGILAQYRAEQV